MRHRGITYRLASPALALLVMVTALALPPPDAAAATVETFADDFETEDFTGSTGSSAWGGFWIEGGESDGPGNGVVRIEKEGRCETGSCILLGKDKGVDSTLTRSVDLGEFAAASLTFDYEVHQHGSAAGQIDLEISDDGGNNWYPLETWTMEDVAATTGSYDLSLYAASGTQIRFVVLGSDDDSHLNVDNLVITATRPNQAPAFDQDLGDRSDAAGALITLSSPATDPDSGDTLVYSAAGLPEGLAIDTSTGEVAGALSPNSAGTHSVTITVSDNGSPSLQDTDSFEWTVAQGHNFYLVAESGGGGGGSNLLTATDPADLDPATNEIDIGLGTGTGSIGGADIQPGTGILYAANGDQLGTIDPTSGVFSATSARFGTGDGADGTRNLDDINALAFHPITGELFAINWELWGPDHLFRVDPNTGAHIPGAFGGDDYVVIESASGMSHDPALAFDPSTGTLYAIATNGLESHLVTINPTTGAATDIGPTAWSIQGLAFTPEGGLWGATWSGNNLYEIDKADGTASNGRTIDNGDQYVALAITGPAVVNSPPVFEQDLPDRTDAEGAVIAVSGGATDPDGGDSLTYGATGLPPGLVIDTGSGSISGTIGYNASSGSPYAVAITVTDNGFPNMAAAPDTFTWTITDTNQAPTVAHPGPQTTPELALFSLGLTANDPDGQIPSFSDGGTLPAWAVLTDNLDGTATISGTPGVGDSGTTTVTITVSDGGVPDLTDDTVFDITVTNVNQPPSIADPGDQSGTEGTVFSMTVTGSDPDGTTVGFTDSGTLPGWAILIDNGNNTAAIVGTPGFSDAATTTVTIIVTDGALTADAVFDIAIANTNLPPVVDPVTDRTVAEGSPLLPIPIAASDPDGNTPSLTASGLPGWASLADNGDGTGLISGTPGYTAAGTSTITVTASDGSLTGDRTFALAVTETNRPPVFDADLVDRSDGEGTTISLSAGAIDPDGGPLEYRATGLPTDLAIDPSTGLISGSLGYTSAGIYNVVVTVSDVGSPTLTDTDIFVWTVTDTNRQPVIETIAPVIGVEETALSFGAAATDPDDDLITFSIAGAPPGAVIDAATGVFTWTPAEVHGTGSFAITVIATDNGTPSLSVDTTATITATEANRPPVIEPIGDRHDLAGSSIGFAVEATDPDIPLNTLTYQATGLPDGLSMHAATGLISGTIETDADGTYEVSIIVTDDGSPGLDDATNFTWVVGGSNHPPVLTVPTDLRINELSTISFQATATDGNGDSTSFSLRNEPQGASIDPRTGAFSWTPSEAQGPAAHTFAVVVTDNGSPQLSAIHNVTIFVAEVNQAPTLQPLVDRANTEGTIVSVVINAADDDLPQNTLGYSAIGLPPGLTIDPVTGVIGGTVGAPTAAETDYQVTLTVNDGGEPALEATTGFTWTTSSAPEEPAIPAPTVTPIDNRYVNAGNRVELAVDATGVTPLTFAATGLPPGITIDSVTGVISGTAGIESVGTHHVVIEITDSGDPIQHCSTEFMLTVIDREAADDKVALLVGISDEPESRPVRRGLVVMSSAAAATTRSMQLPMALLLALMAGFATIGRIGLYPLLWRGDRHTGTISFFDPEGGFGLIDPDDGGEAVFVHAHAFPRRQRGTFGVGTRIRYRVLAGDNRSSAWGATTELGK